MQKVIHASIIRGGTSKGIYFLEKNLPKIQSKRDNIFLKVMGSPDIFG
jgi:2-methylaconitate cis-trans-isomerase PrpF